MKICQYRECGKALRKTAKKYCNNRCKNDETRIDKIEKWYSGEYDGSTRAGLSITIKKHLLELCNYKCPQCGWGERNVVTNNVPLEVNHIDGDYRNNSPENIELLCPNCHSLTENFRALNGTGRGRQMKYNQYELVPQEQKDKRKAFHAAKRICKCGKKKEATAKNCSLCHLSKISSKYPDLNKLVKMVEEHGYVGTGKILGMSDNAIRKHLRRNGFQKLPKKKTQREKDIENY